LIPGRGSRIKNGFLHRGSRNTQLLPFTTRHVAFVLCRRERERQSLPISRLQARTAAVSTN
jgi:hypothetical protein